MLLDTMQICPDLIEVAWSLGVDDDARQIPAGNQRSKRHIDRAFGRVLVTVAGRE